MIHSKILIEKNVKECMGVYERTVDRNSGVGLSQLSILYSPKRFFSY